MRSIRQSIERFLLSVTRRPWQQRRHQRLVLERAAGCDLIVLPEVMNPRIFRSGEFFANALRSDLIIPSSLVLDMGAGSGIAGIVAAQHNACVVAVDINPAAVRCTRINAYLNKVEQRLDVRQGDLFEPVKDERFDLVLFNPPYFRGSPQPGFDQSWRSEDVVERFAAGLRHHLKPAGSALLALSTDGDMGAFIHAFNEYGYEKTVVASRRLLAETLTVYRFRPRCKE